MTLEDKDKDKLYLMRIKEMFEIINRNTYCIFV